ncbi:bromodomain adjacent to zinc finger domain protein 2B isoform X2 [Fundulus heteroclitus]|uniref:bromodomain adjacent to zinc finger domain protein 2B isoform X2 n=1 Tax=Fundulus heteroclitus TaxID=8078 RepID=UPI00165A1D36|nr:bromodomain adjacent to zinc finger domain protein 2B isoform X2 [Fundulus heteroclitus]
MPRRCVAMHCSHEDGRLYEWPKDRLRARLWTKFVQTKRMGFKVNRKVVTRPLLCYRHFKEDCFLNLKQYQSGYAKRLLLNSTAVPTIHMPRPTGDGGASSEAASSPVTSTPRSPRSAYEKREHQRQIDDAINESAMWGRPASEMKECDPDWTTSLNLDHAGVKAVGPAKFDLLRGTGKTLKQRQATSPLPTSSGSDMDDEAMFPAGLKIESQRLEANSERYKRKRRRPGPCDTPEQEEEYSMDHCSDVLKLVVIEEELPAEEQNQSPMPVQEDQKPPQIKVEQEDQKPPQIKVEQEDQKPPQIKEEQEDTEIMQFTFDSVTVKIEDHEEKPHIPDLLYSQPVENTDFVGTNQCLESDDEDKTCNSSSETDVSDGHCEESEAQPATDPSAVCKQRWPHANRSNETMAGSRGLIKHASALSAKGGVAYFKKLTLTNGKRLRDPRKITVWKDDVKTWPNIQWSDIYTYLVEKTRMYTREELRAYKSLDAYDYMIGGHLKKVTYHDLDSEFCVLKSESKQQKTTTYNAWVIINKADNYILSADCTCMVGHGYCCSHVAAILFKIELCVRMGETGKAEVASGVCTLKDSSKEVQPAPLREISFHRSKQLKRRLPGTSKIGPNRVALRVLTLDDILELHAVEPDAAVLTSLDSSDTDTASSGEHDESDDDSDDDSDDTNEEQTD